jgi:hypothetical protein
LPQRQKSLIAQQQETNYGFETVEHDEVKEIVEDWLEKSRTSPEIVGEPPVAVENADVIVYLPKDGEEKTAQFLHLQVECKKSKDDVADAIGQCLKYFTRWDSLLTYLAVPEDIKDLTKLECILQFVNLPIGLLVVSNDHKVEVRKKSEGKNSVFIELGKW